MSNIFPAPNGLLSRAAMDYTRHQPEKTLLYQVIDEHYPAFLSHLYESGKSLPQYLQDEFEAYLKCGRLEHGFLRVQCESCQREQLVAFSCKRRGFCPSCGAKRMVESAAKLVDEVLRRETLSIHCKARCIHTSDRAIAGWQNQLRVEDSLSKRHNACGI